MKKQEQSNGVRKWYGSDWLDIQNEICKILESGLLGNASNVILSGIKRTGVAPNYNYTSGICFIDGKLCTFAGGFVTSATTIYLTLDSTEIQTRNYLNGSINPVSRTYKAIASTVNPGVGVPHIVYDSTFSTNFQPRFFIPHKTSAGALENVPKVDFLLDNPNVLVSGAALEILRAIMQGQFDNLPSSYFPLAAIGSYNQTLGFFSYDAGFIASDFDAMFDALAVRVNASERVASQGSFNNNQTVIFYDDTKLRVYYDGVDRYVKIQNKTTGTMSKYIKVYKTASTEGVTQQPAAIATYHLTPTNAADVAYQWSGVTSAYGEFHVYANGTPERTIKGKLMMNGTRLSAIITVLTI